MLTALSIGRGGLGRFGNQLFTIAGIIGTAIKNGQDYGFPDWINHDNVLFGGSADRMDLHFVNPLPRIPDNYVFQDYGYFWGYRDLRIATGNWSIDAHFQDERYFKPYISVIRQQFRMVNEPDQTEYVAIHFRAGDYIDDPSAYHPRCTAEYYQKAIEYFPLGTRFVLFSDDPASFPLINVINCYISAGKDYIQDFKMMKRCKSFITANSSFSLMAAILGEHPEKKIICPRNWFGSCAGITFDGYPEGAIII